MPDSRARATARSVAGGARPPREARSAPRRSLPVLTPRPRTEPLVLAKRALGRRTAELFIALDAEPELRRRFVRDPAGVVGERVHEHRAPRHGISEANRLIVSMLTNDGFTTWCRGHQKAHPEASEDALVQAIIDAIVEHADEDLLERLGGSDGACERLLGDAAQRIARAVAMPAVRPSSGRPPIRPGRIHQGAKTLSIVPTHALAAACSDGASTSSPGARERLSQRVMLDAIAQAKALGFRNVVLTAGAPTLHGRDLLACITYATSLGMRTRVVSNASWAVSLPRAGEQLDVLVEHGLSEIEYDTGDEHARFVPVERVAYAIAAALDRELPVEVTVELRAERRLGRATLLEHPLVVERAERAERLLEVRERPWMPHEHEHREGHPAGVPTDAEGLSWPRGCGCGSVLQTYALHADGRIGACGGLGTRLVPELGVARAEGGGFLQQAIERAEEDFLKLWLRYVGPQELLAWAARKDPSIAWEGMVAHPCQACRRIYEDPRVGAVIREHHEEAIAEVLQSAWLEERYIPEALRERYVPEREGA